MPVTPDSAVSRALSLHGPLSPLVGGIRHLQHPFLSGGLQLCHLILSDFLVALISIKELLLRGGVTLGHHLVGNPLLHLAGGGALLVGTLSILGCDTAQGTEAPCT